MIAVALATWASASPLAIEVVPVPSRPRAERRPWVEPRVPYGVGDARIDGVVDDPVWARTDAAGPLLPHRTGPRPPETELRVALGGEGLMMAVSELPEGATAHLLVDPDGLGQRWWRVRVGAEETRWQRCSLDAVEFRFWNRIGDVAAPCREVEALGRVARGEGFEVEWSWRSLPAATEHLAVGFWVVDTGGGGGTWAPNGGRHGPGEGGPLLLPEEWTWTHWARGRIVATGALSPAERAGFEVPIVAGPDQRIEVAARGAHPLAAAGWARLPQRTWEAAVVTPVFDEHVEVAFTATPGRPGLPVSILDASGQTLGAGEVDLPAGSGALRIRTEGAWPDRVRVRLGELDAGPALRRRP